MSHVARREPLLKPAAYSLAVELDHGFDGTNSFLDAADNPAGYRPMLWMFMMLSLFGFVFAFALRRRETSPEGHGLESIKAAV